MNADIILTIKLLSASLPVLYVKTVIYHDQVKLELLVGLTFNTESVKKRGDYLN